MSQFTFPLTGPINLSVRLGHGTVAVLTRDDLSAATVELSAADPAVLERITVEMQGHTLAVHAPRAGGLADVVSSWRGENREAVDAVVTVPTRTAARISTFTAPVSVEGTLGGADISTGTGDIRLDAVDGDLRLRYGSADAEVGSVSGSVTVRSGAGNARFGDIGGTLQSGCGSGRLDVERVQGRVHARCGSGEATLGAVFADVDLASGSGGMSIGLPAGLSVRLDVTTGSGRVDSELPIEDHPSSGGNAIVVRARTGSGRVRLFRAAAAA